MWNILTLHDLFFFSCVLRVIVNSREAIVVYISTYSRDAHMNFSGDPFLELN